MDALATGSDRSAAIRILAVDHFYEQDLDALQAAGAGHVRIDRIPYQRIHALARRHFPVHVFSDVRTSAEPQYRANWRSYRADAARFADWILACYQPNLLILPSDTIFYFRPIIERVREHGIATVIVQKETTISPMTMDIDSQYVAAAVPFMADFMTVCSERHRDFWLIQGVDPSKILVTGQPRFDVYAAPPPPRPADGPPRLLYFSYDDFAYLPYDGTSTPLGDWTELRRATETTLADLATSRVWEVIAKPHPQQVSMRDWLGAGVTRAPAAADTRELIRSVDAVVGFQTTALFEAALAGKPVIYAAWGSVFDRAHDLLVPFEEYDDLVLHAESAGQLRAALVTPETLASRVGPSAREAAMLHLGAIDGGACARVLAVLEEFSRPPVGVRPPWRLLPRAAAAGSLAPMLRAAVPSLRRIGRADLAAACRRRADRGAQQGREAVALVRARGGHAA